MRLARRVRSSRLPMGVADYVEGAHARSITGVDAGLGVSVHAAGVLPVYASVMVYDGRKRKLRATRWRRAATLVVILLPPVPLPGLYLRSADGWASGLLEQQQRWAGRGAVAQNSITERFHCKGVHNEHSRRTIRER